MLSVVDEIIQEMLSVLDNNQLFKLRAVLKRKLSKQVDITNDKSNKDYLETYLDAKKVEGCSEKTLRYYEATITSFIKDIDKSIKSVTTGDLREYLTSYQQERNSSKVTIDNIRRIFSSFFSWLEDEDIIIKSLVRRIHKVRVPNNIKETYSDEELEKLRDCCTNFRDLALIDLLSTTGMRVGELVRLNRSDLDFEERECVVLGKGSKERVVYFDARSKLHIKNYLANRKDDNEALFVTLKSPWTRVTIGGIESRIRHLGAMVGIKKAHPHKFRRTLATNAIDKGMPIEQLQKLLGHERIDTTLHYAMVKQTNVKLAHKMYVG